MSSFISLTTALHVFRQSFDLPGQPPLIPLASHETAVELVLADYIWPKNKRVDQGSFWPLPPLNGP